MKAKSIKRSCLAFGLSGLLAFSTIGLKDNIVASGDLLDEAALWTTYNTYTVLQNPADMKKEYVIPPTVLSEGESVSLEITMGRGEDENAQLIITPKKDVDYYNVSVSDLKCGDNVIPKENIEIFNQYYSYVDNSYGNMKYVPVGMTPDYLIPMKWAVDVGENKIKAGNNQGITIEVETKADTVSGVYNGNITLTLDGKTKDVPLTVDVKDVDVSESTMPIIAASFAEIQDRSVYEKLMDYRVMGQYMYKGNYSPDAMVEELRRYYRAPRFGGYEIPNVSPDVFESYVRAIAQACDTDNENYFTKAFVYLQNIDEVGSVDKIIETVNSYVAKKNAIRSQLSTLMPSATSEFRQSVADAISLIPLYHASYFINYGNADPAAAGLTHCYNYYDLGVSEEEEYDYRKNNATEPLVYSNNYFPAIANSLPNYGQANRYMGWTQAKYDYAGMLLWGANEITTEITSNRGSAAQYRVRNYYDDLRSWGEIYSGNAAHVIPAKKYGYPTDWVFNLRIAAMRDGVEDHNLVAALEKTYKNLGATYGVSKDFDDCIDFIYKRAFYTSYTYFIDGGETLYEMRDMVYDLIDLAKSPVKLMITGGGVEGDKASVSFCADADTVKVNGTTVGKQNGQYSFTWGVNDSDTVIIELTKNGQTYTFGGRIFSYGKVKKISDNVSLTADNVANYVTSSPSGGTGKYKNTIPAGTVDYAAADQKIKISIPECQETDALKIIGYSPRFTLDRALFGVEDFYEISYISMKIRVKYKSGSLNASVPLIIKLNQSTSNTLKLWTVVFNKDSCVFAGGWYERYVTFRVDKYYLQDIKQLSFTFQHESYLWTKQYNMGADVEISDICYSLCEYPNKGV